jgi:hypothetical protein
VCPFGSTGKRPLYVYMSNETWMQKNFKTVFSPNATIASSPSTSRTNKTDSNNSKTNKNFGIQISKPGGTEAYFDNVHTFCPSSDYAYSQGLTNFIIRDWVMYGSLINLIV